MRSSPILSTNPAASSAVPQVLLHPGHRENNSTPFQFSAQLIEGIQRREVDLDIRLRVEHEPLDPSRIVVDGSDRAFAEVLGVREEQWGVVAVNQQPGHQVGLRIASYLTGTTVDINGGSHIH